MNDRKGIDPEGGGVRSWVTVCAISFGFLAWGMMLYWTVGDKGPPSWDYGVVEDVPGLSPFSTAGPKEVPGLVPSTGRRVEEVEVQHVRGSRTEDRGLKAEGG